MSKYLVSRTTLQIIIYIVVSYVSVLFMLLVPSKKVATIIAAIVVFYGMYILVKNVFKRNAVCLLMVLIYYIFTQFGASFTYYICDPSITEHFGKSSTFFLLDEFYIKNLILAVLGFSSCFFGLLFCNPNMKKSWKKDIKSTQTEFGEKIYCFLGIIFLLVAAIYFSYYVLTGIIYIGMDYTDYRSSGVIGGIYEWIIVFYMFGICFVVASNNSRYLKYGYILFGYTAIILLLFGNRGEVLYPTLACFGVYLIKTRKIPIKLLILCIVIVLFGIPFLKLYRHMGTMTISELLDELNPLAGIAEMGISMRMTSYMMQELDMGQRSLLYGFSYYNPLINIIDRFVPFSIRLTPPSSFNFTNDFYALKSMTTVAESYANFGTLGVILHHIAMGTMLCAVENRIEKVKDLAFAGSITSVFIYSVRSTIASVPIELLLCVFIYMVIDIFEKFIRSKRVKIYE